LQNGETKTGLFQDMFEGDLLTFNPKDAHTIQAALKEAGYRVENSIAGEDGPGSVSIKYPDGWSVFMDRS
jgi:hypothetical protein